MNQKKAFANPLYKADKIAWIETGLQVLADRGRSFLDIDTLAKKLRATKGSFYWHFKTKREYELCLYGAFEDRTLSYLVPVPELDAESLSLLLANSFLQIPYSELRLELAIRDWARQDPTLFRKCCDLDQRRLEWLVDLLRRARVTRPEAKASQVFAITVGYGLIPEFLGQEHKVHYAQAIASLLLAS